MFSLWKESDKKPTTLDTFFQMANPSWLPPNQNVDAKPVEDMEDARMNVMRSILGWSITDDER